jgi:hypothetical protein
LGDLLLRYGIQWLTPCRHQVRVPASKARKSHVPGELAPIFESQVAQGLRMKVAGYLGPEFSNEVVLNHLSSPPTRSLGGRDRSSSGLLSPFAF